eukprot:gene11068-7699_t
MVHLSFFEDIADKAGLIIPTVYLPIVEECTDPALSAPAPKHVTFLLEKMRTTPDDVGEILRALRRRMNSDEPRIRGLTVMLLHHLVRNGTPTFHNELAGHKGLLRELENTATSTSGSEAWRFAVREARLLVLNMSVWFMNHPNPNCHILTTIVTDVKQTSGPSSFAGITVDSDVHLQMPATHTRRRQGPPPPSEPQRQRQNRSAASAASLALPSTPPGTKRAPRAPGNHPSLPSDRIVQAIPLDLPTEASISAMLDTCATLAEYLANAEVDPVTGAYVRDDVLVSFCNKVQEDHSYLALLLSSDVDIDRDVMRSLLDSHSAVLKQVRDGKPLAARASPVGAQETKQPAPAASASPATHQDPFADGMYRPRAAATADEEQTGVKPAPLLGPTAPEDDDFLVAQPAAPPPPPITQAAPTLESLFDEVTTEMTVQPTTDVPAPDSVPAPETAPAAADTNANGHDDDFDDFLEKELGN